jgi:UDPglucose 6-dehydrogenase
VVDKVKRAVARATSASVDALTPTGGDLAGAVIAVWGLTFKAGTDDLRNSPSVEIIKRLVAEGATVQAFDPTVKIPSGKSSAPVEELSRSEAGGTVATLDDSVRAFSDAYAACEGASAVVVLTEWDEFRWLDFSRVRERLAAPVVVDARNLLDPAQLRRIGFDYTGIGRR